MASSSSPVWDVFLSFYGKDTRNSFISHLYNALDQAGIETFIDDHELEKGEEISSGLRNAIRSSKMFVVVISENYAKSRWCLDELVEILGCKETNNQVVPVFYYVDPSDLRYLKGSFSEPLKSNNKRYSVDTIENWRSALAKIADISGYHLKKEENKSEAETIKEIVEKVMPPKMLDLDQYLPGVDHTVQEIYQKLSMELSDVRALRIWGMGGIGKTTIAKAFFNKYSHKFDISCFMDNLKQTSQGRSAPLALFQQLLSELLRRKDLEVRDVESALRRLKGILGSKKALIVLDDLDRSSYFEFLEKICKLFSKGSRIIITARDKNLLNQLKDELSTLKIYKVKPLEKNDSLELFCHHAFKKPAPPRSFEDLSKSFVTYAEGLPLALKVLGSYLHRRTKDSWNDKLKKIQKNPVEDIQKILKMSYDELDDETVKAIFLEIVFFFVGKKRYEAVDVFDSCNLFPADGIPMLVEKCLLTIEEDGRLQMHNLIQEMGWSVIREESEIGKCKRLCLDQEKACQALEYADEGMDKVEGLILDFSTSINKYCNAKMFERLRNLRLLKFVDVHGIRGDLMNTSSFHELRCISWHNCPWTRLPSSFRLQKLVSLDMPCSRFETLWTKDVKLPSLRHLNLEGCKHLKELPESIGQLTSLGRMNLNSCLSLERLPQPIIQLTTLGFLDMSWCQNLKLLPEQLGDMKCLQMLDVSCTAIVHLPDSVADLKKLTHLELFGCKELKRLPEQFGNMEGLQEFHASESGIEQLPDSFSNLINLVQLELSGCEYLTGLPKSIGNMQCLVKLIASYTAIEELPDSIGQLPRIRRLDFEGCEKLNYVPDSIRDLRSLGTLLLEHKDNRMIELPDAVNNPNLEYLDVRCNVSVWLPVILSFSSLRTLDLQDEGPSLSTSEPFSFSKLFNLDSLKLTNCTSLGSSFPELPLKLRWLQVHNHASLEQVPDLSNNLYLQDLTISRCSSLQSLQKLPHLLQTLKICDCESLQDLPDLSMCQRLYNLVVIRNGRDLKVSLEETQFQFNILGIPEISFRATLDNREIPEWFDHKNSSGHNLSFDIPSIGDNFEGVTFWVVYKYLDVLHEGNPVFRTIKAVITNKTEGTPPHIHTISGEEPFSGECNVVQCINGDEISVKSGDRIEVSFQFSYPPANLGTRVKMCGAHINRKEIKI